MQREIPLRLGVMVALLLGFFLLAPLATAGAQSLDVPARAPSLATAPPASILLGAAAPPVTTRNLGPSGAPAGRQRDRVTGAVYGLAIGALVGGVGFAAANYLFTESSPRDEWTVPSFMLGAAVGGAVGMIAGAIIGVPVRDKDVPRQVRLQVVPDLGRGAAFGVSLSVPTH